MLFGLLGSAYAQSFDKSAVEARQANIAQISKTLDVGDISLTDARNSL